MQVLCLNCKYKFITPNWKENISIFAVRKLTGLPLSLTGLRKVRATQSIPLPNGKQSATADKRRRKQPPQGKGEKVG